MDISSFYSDPLLFLPLVLVLKEPHTHAYGHPQPQIKVMPVTLLIPGQQVAPWLGCLCVQSAVEV